MMFLSGNAEGTDVNERQFIEPGCLGRQGPKMKARLSQPRRQAGCRPECGWDSWRDLQQREAT